MKNQTHKTTEQTADKPMVIKGGVGRAGHQDRTCHHVHDNRPKRQRQRGQAKRYAIREQSY